MSQFSEKPNQKSEIIRFNYQKIPQISVDLSECWDSVSMFEVIISALHSASFYRKGLLYSGFNADDIIADKKSPEVIFCSPEELLFQSGDDEIEDPHFYARQYKNPAIGVYDSEKMVSDGSNCYTPSDSSAMLGIILLK